MKTLYWQWYGIHIPLTFWRQHQYIGNHRRRTLTLNESTHGS